MKARELVLQIENQIKDQYMRKSTFCEKFKLNSRNVRALLNRVLKEKAGANIDNVEEIANPLGYELRLVNIKTGKIL